MGRPRYDLAASTTFGLLLTGDIAARRAALVGTRDDVARAIVGRDDDSGQAPPRFLGAVDAGRLNAAAAPRVLEASVHTYEAAPRLTDGPILSAVGANVASTYSGLVPALVGVNVTRVLATPAATVHLVLQDARGGS